MYMKKWFLSLLTVIFMIGCSTAQIEVDYDPEYKFSSLKSFSVVYTNEKDGKDFKRDRISKLLDTHMKGKGYVSVEKSKANFYVIMHFDIKQKSQVETNYETIGIRPAPYTYWGVNRAYPYPSAIRPVPVVAMEPDVRAITRTHEYEEGNLIVEIFDVKENRVVWQGIARDRFSSAGDSQEEKSEYLNKVLSELFKDFPLKK